MTSEDAILSEIRHVRTDFAKMDKRMEGMEAALNIVAVQTEQINVLNREAACFKQDKKDIANTMGEIKQWQASCPRDQIEKMEDRQKETMKNQWAAIKVLAGAMLTGFGVLGAFIRWAQ